MLSDGECAEGSVWESLRVAWENKVHNLKIVINANGWSAYDQVNLSYLTKRIKAFGFDVKKIDGHDIKSITKVLGRRLTKNPTVIFANTSSEQFPFLNGQDAHYYKLKQEDYNLAIKLLS